MSIPKDPVMLLSYVNTQLRDNYSSLDEFCAAQGVSAEKLTADLDSILLILFRNRQRVP